MLRYMYELADAEGPVTFHLMSAVYILPRYITVTYIRRIGFRPYLKRRTKYDAAGQGMLVLKVSLERGSRLDSSKCNLLTQVLKYSCWSPKNNPNLSPPPANKRHRCPHCTAPLAKDWSMFDFLQLKLDALRLELFHLAFLGRGDFVFFPTHPLFLAKALVHDVHSLTNTCTIIKFSIYSPSLFLKLGHAFRPQSPEPSSSPAPG
ncbi:hypothetical protein F4779DRAFT_291844 [Xylariaceae sp. FL0662B]|nr:hypothetical protein F4779DRAFT_291844 [Xylariaceae sp. FL0662B]